MIRPFIINQLNTADITNGNSASYNVTVSAENGFKLQEIRTTGTSKMRVSIKKSTGELFSSSPFDAGLIGAGANKLLFNEPIVLPDKEQLEIAFTNNTGSTVTANTFELQLIGTKE